MATHQIRSLSHRRRLLGGAYIDKVLGHTPILYYPMNETSGSAAVNLGSLGSAANGSYTGVTLNDALGPDGVHNAPLFDGANDYLDAMTAPLVNAWDAGGDEWSVMVWWKVYNAGVWTDGLSRAAISTFDTGSDYFSIYRSSNNNTFVDAIWVGGGTSDMNQTGGLSTTAWVCSLVTRSEAADLVTYYRDGALVTTDTGLGAWASATPWARLLIGANTTTPTLVWYGWLAHVAIWDRPLTLPAAVDLATP